MQKNLSKIVIALLVLSALFIFFKKFDKKVDSLPVTEQALEYSNKLPDDFHDFYNSFHTDSTFQMEHIIFPLNGLGESQDSTKLAEPKEWLASEWILHKPFNDHGGTFEREFTNVNGIVTEILIGNSGMFTMEKRYAKLSGEWHLIYYQELIMAG